MKKEAGFTLIELVVVVVILGLLAVTAIPKFVDLTEQAKEANIQGMAGGFATGVSLARAQWEAEARPTANNVNTVDYDGSQLVLTTPPETVDPNPASQIRPGYPTGLVNGNADLTGMNATRCQEVWEGILQQPPITAVTIADLNNNEDSQYFIRVSADQDGLESSVCIYYLKETLDKNSDGDYQTPADETVGNNFTYDPANSAVLININNN